MSFTSNDYLTWYLPRVRGNSAAINLHASGMPALAPEDIAPAKGDQWQMVPRFEAALATWLEAEPDEICFTPGATGGSLLALLSLVEGGDEIVVESPIYEPMLRQAERLAPVRRLARRMEGGWRLSLDEIERVVGPGTGLVMVTEPSNPSGTHVPREEMLSLAARAKEHGATLLINEVYRHFAGTPSYHGAADNIVVTGSLSKLLGAYGFRLGWLSGSRDVARALRAAHWNLGAPTLPAAAYGLGVLELAPELTARARELAVTGAVTVGRWVEATDGLEWVAPTGAGFGCVSLPEGVGDDVSFVERLADDRGVLAVPGSLFGVPGTVRVSWLQAGDRLEEGLELLAAAL